MQTLRHPYSSRITDQESEIMGRAKQKKPKAALGFQLNDTQKNINRIRKRMNRLDMEQEKVKMFTKYKLWTYMWVFLFPPYGMYRVWKKNSTFTYSERMIQTITCVTYTVVLINIFLTK